MTPDDMQDEKWQFLRSFLNASNASIVIADARAPDYPIVYVNPTFERVTGYARAEALGRNCRFLQNDDRDQPERAAVARALAAGSAIQVVLRNYRKNGEMFWNKLHLFPFPDAAGRITHIIGAQHDVTLEQSLVATLEQVAAERAEFIERLDCKRDQLARLSLDLINAQEAERKAVARELHDELGQRLTALNLLLHRSRPLYRSADAYPLWRQAEQELAALVELVRDMSVSLRPPGLDYFGLEPTLRELLTRQFSLGPTWIFEYAGLPRRLAPEIEITVFRIVQESVTNIQRHAQARHVVVEVNGGAAGHELELIVRDDGRGFDPSRQAELAHAGRAGLSGMRERVGLLGGTFEVDSQPRGGTRIVVTLPLAPPQALSAHSSRYRETPDFPARPK